jgi:lysophospholipase L1-like esterase
MKSSGERPGTPQPGCAGKLLLMVLGIVMALVLMEVAARLVLPNPGRIEYVPDEVVGFRLRPQQQVQVSNEVGEFKTLFTTNAYGYPDRERSVAKGEGVYRIAMIGDSMVQASQVELTERFPWLLEEQLTAWVRQQDGAIREVEVMNFGTAGYSTAQAWLTYREYVRRFEPDLVLLFFLPGNDIKNNSYELEVVRSCRRALMPFYTLDAGGQLVLQDEGFYENAVAQYEAANASGWRGAMRELQERVRLVKVAHRGYVALRGALSADVTAAEPESEDVDCQTAATLELFDPTLQATDRTWQQAWQVTAALVAALAEDVSQDGAAFHVAIVNGPWIVQEETRDLALPPQAQDAYDWEMPHKKTEEMLDELGLAYTSLRQPMLDAAQAGTQVHFVHDGHYTPAGHHVVAETLLPVLQAYISEQE